MVVGTVVAQGYHRLMSDAQRPVQRFITWAGRLSDFGFQFYCGFRLSTSLGRNPITGLVGYCRLWNLVLARVLLLLLIRMFRIPLHLPHC